MLPLQQAREVRDSVIEYIKATFRFKEKGVSDAFYRFIEDKKNGLFKGTIRFFENSVCICP